MLIRLEVLGRFLHLETGRHELAEPAVVEDPIPDTAPYPMQAEAPSTGFRLLGQDGYVVDP